MKTYALTTAVLLGGLTSAAGAVTFQEIARVDASSFTDGDNQADPSYIGTNLANIAWDGTTLFAAGFNATGGTANVGIVRIDNPLTTPTVSTAFGVQSTPDTFSYTGLDLSSEGLLAAYDSGAANDFGVAVYETNNTLRWKVGDTDAAFRPQGGADWDPGFDTGSGVVDSGAASKTFGSGRRWLWNANTGANIYNGSSGFITFVDTSAWRDLAFAPDGDLYYRGQNDVFVFDRTGGNAGSPTKIVDLTNAPGVVGQHVEVITTDAGSFVIYNDRNVNDPDQPFANVVNIVNTDGSAADVTLAFDTGLGGDPADGNGFYDFAYDPGSQTLALSDFLNDTIHIFQIAAGLPGDYNDDGAVDQGDLDLVLLNWGDDASVTGVPAGWINEQPTGLIGQLELDGVLLNWGDTAEATGSAVPEPAAAALLALGALAMRRRHAD